MATKKKAEVKLDPVSAEVNVEFKVFDPPQGDMLGFAIATDTIKGKDGRVAHAYLMATGPEVTLDPIRGKLTVEAMQRLGSVYMLFGDKVTEFYANRNAT
jgi:hypothetical protein